MRWFEHVSGKPGGLHLPVAPLTPCRPRGPAGPVGPAGHVTLQSGNPPPCADTPPPAFGASRSRPEAAPAVGPGMARKGTACYMLKEASLVSSTAHVCN